MEIYDRWRPHFADGGPIPEEAKQYFSPAFLWTRLPLGKDSDQLIEKVFFSAFCEYLDLYMKLVDDSILVSDERAETLLKGQRRYLNYRIEKDPARGMLSRFYGNEWTEEYIHNVLFAY